MTQGSSAARSGSSCTHFTLARGVVAEIEFCPACGVFHVNIDSMSMRFRATALRDLRDTISQALANYERAVAEVPEERQPVAAREDLH